MSAVLVLLPQTIVVAKPDCGEPPEGLLDWWSLGRGAASGVEPDDASHNNEGIHVDNLGDLPGAVLENGNSLYFGPPDDPMANGYVKVVSHAEVNFGTESFTITARIKLARVTGHNVIVEKRTNTRGYKFFVFHGRLGLLMHHGQGKSFIAPGNSPRLQKDKWHFVAVTVERGLAEGKLYLDHQLVHKFVPVAGSLDNEFELRIGRATRGVTRFEGDIDQIEFYRFRALDAAELKGVHANNKRCPSSCTPPPGMDWMTAWFPFDAIRGPVPNATTLNIVPGTKPEGTLVGIPGSCAGRVWSAIKLDGADDHVVVPTGTEVDLDIGDFSFDFWLKTTASKGRQVILSKMAKSGSNFQGYEVFLDNGRLGLQLAVGGKPTNAISANPNLADGVWHLVGVAVDRTLPYLNGTFSIWGPDSVTTTFFPPLLGNLSNGEELMIGRGGVSGQFFKGCIDEVEIWNGYVLTQDDLGDISRAGWRGKCRPPLPD